MLLADYNVAEGLDKDELVGMVLVLVPTKTTADVDTPRITQGTSFPK
ncbi:hypothetical protein [Streptomyces formicae]|uniref:Uncharacterized protein n=1 Tax=Streptomyces formicae TaxID=1616117 RepID=A0ABY3WIG7_9ACTN|nr:hypothetical protein [Streptomyces formicae]UNM12378.1 hypothetical protein J4032_13255 [Streptomyces formicae]